MPKLKKLPYHSIAGVVAPFFAFALPQDYFYGFTMSGPGHFVNYFRKMPVPPDSAVADMQQSR
ncbi:MAG: hypothetical protein WBO29_03790 [Albidovulum sp.]